MGLAYGATNRIFCTVERFTPVIKLTTFQIHFKVVSNTSTVAAKKYKLNIQTDCKLALNSQMKKALNTYNYTDDRNKLRIESSTKKYIHNCKFKCKQILLQLIITKDRLLLLKRYNMQFS